MVYVGCFWQLMALLGTSLSLLVAPSEPNCQKRVALHSVRLALGLSWGVLLWHLVHHSTTNVASGEVFDQDLLLALFLRH